MFTTSCSRNRINQIPVDEAFIKSFNEVRVLHDPGLIYMNRDDVTHLPLEPNIFLNFELKTINPMHTFGRYFDSSIYRIISPNSRYNNSNGQQTFLFYGGVYFPNGLSGEFSFTFWNNAIYETQHYQYPPNYPIVFGLENNGEYSYVLSFIRENWNNIQPWSFNEMLYVLYKTEVPYRIYYDNHYIYLMSKNETFSQEYLELFKQNVNMFFFKD